MPHQCTACGHTFADGSKGMLGGCPDCGGNKFQFYPEGTEIPDEPPDGVESPAPPEAEGSSVASTVGRATTKVRDFVSSNSSMADDPPGRTADDPPSRAADDVSGRDQSDSPVDSDDSGNPNPNAPWPDSTDAADPIRKGGFREEEPSNSDSSKPESSADESSGDGAVGDRETLDDGDIIDADARAASDAVDQAEDVAQSDARARIASDAEVAAAGNRVTDEPIADASGNLESAEETVDRDAETADGRVVSEPTGEEPDISELRQQLNDQFESIKILEPGQYELNLMELYDREEYIIALQENGRYVIQVPEQWMGDRDTE